jgi:hypothetical protein
LSLKMKKTEKIKAKPRNYSEKGFYIYIFVHFKRLFHFRNMPSKWPKSRGWTP